VLLGAVIARLAWLDADYYEVSLRAQLARAEEEAAPPSPDSAPPAPAADDQAFDAPPELTPFDRLAEHPRHPSLRPSGPKGHWLGLIGTLLIGANLAYMARRRLRVMQRVGSLRAWMAVHVIAGLGGAGFIVLHSALTLRSDAARYASYALGVLVATGIVGRWIYAAARPARLREDPDVIVSPGAMERLLQRWRVVHLAAAIVMLYTLFRHVDSAIANGFRGPLPVSLAPWGMGLLVLAAVVSVFELRARRPRKQLAAGLAGPQGEPPATLHPYIDPLVCIGSGACVTACPEGDVLGLRTGRGFLLATDRCIGHGRCEANCPVEAISLVFGSSKRGVDIPDVTEHFESSVPGLYLVGELTGMGLVANCVRQARQAMAHLAGSLRGAAKGEAFDVVIVGGGPAGLTAALAAREAKLRYVLVEQEGDIGGTIRHYPRRKIIMTEPAELPGYGKFQFRFVEKEKLLELWEDVVDHTRLTVEAGVKVASVTGSRDAFVVNAEDGCLWNARRVVLAIGRRGVPRKLAVPGEELDHVAYALRDPDLHKGRHVIIVGGGDAALEGAMACVEAGAKSVHLVHRGKTFDRAKQGNRDRLETFVASGGLEVHYETTTASIDPAHVALHNGRRLDADDVIVLIGGTLPTALLSASGVRVERHFGRPL